MRLFGKPKLGQSEAIAWFVASTAAVVNDQWVWVVSELKGAIPQTLVGRPDFLDLRSTRLVFVIATHAIGLQAVRNIFVEPRGQLVVDCTMAALESAYTDENAGLLLAEFDREWNSALSNQQNPLHALGGVMFNLLRIEDVILEGGKAVMNPVTILALSSVPARLAVGGPKGSGQAWWKMCHDEFNILP